MMRKILNAIKHPKVLFTLILNKMKFLPDKTYLKLRYRIEFGKKLDLKNPKSFNEKLNWLKLYDRKPIYKKMVDKYEVRKYIAEKIGEEYLIPLLGVWNNFDEIDFDALPEQFVLKCTHDSGSVVICKDKSKFDYNAAKAKLERKFNMDLYWWAREWVYKDIKPRIIAEKYMNDGIHDDIMDYKFFCFNGEPKYIYVSENLSDHKKAAISFYDMDFKEAPFRRTDYKNLTYTPDKPLTFDKMAELSKILSKDQYFLRVDFYEISGKIYFGELTFYPAAGYMHIAPDEWDVKLGEMLNIEG